jgi:threonine/homoserine/homoserine lactone efflux protein
MSAEILIAFIAACWLLAWTPGPMMSLILANVSSYGLAAGLWTLAGSIAGLSLLVTAAAFGMTPLMVFMSEWFDLIRWVGALYLAWLGLQRLRQYWRGNVPIAERISSERSWFLQALIVSLSNPKVLLFLGAFLPQFVDKSGDVALQLTALAAIFVIVVGAADAVYTVALGTMRGLMASRRLKFLDGLSGVLLLLGGLVLATARRP